MAQTKRNPKGPNTPRSSGRQTATTPVSSPAPAGATPKPSAAERRAARAGQARLERQRRQRRNLGIAALGVLVLALAAFALLRYQAANRIGTAVAIEGNNHVNSGTSISYRHYPPSSGTHFGDTATRAGVYREEQPEGSFVHALEHGLDGALVKCADGCPETFRQLEDLYRNGLKQSSFGNVKFIVTPYSKPFSDPGKEAPITLLAWGYEEMLPSFDRDKIIRFYNRYVDKGPEAVP